MSTGANCVFEEREPGRWWYRLQKYPYGETEDYHDYGPFDSEEQAEDHLFNHHANPGGWWRVPYAEYATRKQLRP